MRVKRASRTRECFDGLIQSSVDIAGKVSYDEMPSCMNMKNLFTATTLISSVAHPRAHCKKLVSCTARD